jgi:predicted DsbA family dithiol-disulfide isomerase
MACISPQSFSPSSLRCPWGMGTWARLSLVLESATVLGVTTRWQSSRTEPSPQQSQKNRKYKLKNALAWKQKVSWRFREPSGKSGRIDLLL